MPSWEMTKADQEKNVFNLIGDAQTQDFIRANADLSIAETALKLSQHPAFKRRFILNQINGLQKAKRKFPHLLNYPDIIYPEDVSMQQSSSSATAEQKFSKSKGEIAVDLTAGFGIDGMAMAKQFDEVHLVEQSEKLANLLKHNMSVLNLSHVKVHHQSAESFLDQLDHCDLIYLDPSRRSEHERLTDITSFSPDPISMREALFEKSNETMIKFSPGTDSSYLFKTFSEAHQLRIISWKNECRELILEFKQSPSDKICCEEITEGGLIEFQSSISTEKQASLDLSDIRKYLYVPMSSISKAGSFKTLAHAFGFKLISTNTHLLTADQLNKDFPGRTFEVLDSLPYNKKDFKSITDLDTTNIITRNFPDKPEQILKKLGLKPNAGHNKIIAFRDQYEKPCLAICAAIDA